jgi:hypothetical protein
MRLVWGLFFSIAGVGAQDRFKSNRPSERLQWTWDLGDRRDSSQSGGLGLNSDYRQVHAALYYG